mmetsp:Transcript_59234/g.157321  ORF Transcript_59234/g.157321 Transcript_59234/m.157321 type:complete len:95 (-) Transcript_59234:4588-4872(-)
MTNQAKTKKFLSITRRRSVLDSHQFDIAEPENRRPLLKIQPKAIWHIGITQGINLDKKELGHTETHTETHLKTVQDKQNMNTNRVTRHNELQDV